MPGFADVTGWSSLDIQRLGHEDEDRLPIKIYGSKTKKPTFSYLADDVWAAACQAQQVNGTYVKDGQTSVLNPDVICKSNRQITFELLEDPAQITDESREQGKKVRQYYQAYTFKILKGIRLGDFDNNAMLLSNRDVINSNYDMAVVVSLPASYERTSKRDNVDQRVKFATGGYIGHVGDKVTLTIEVMKTVYSQKWNTSYFTGVTSEDQIVFFAYNHIDRLEEGDTYTIQGTIKAHRDNSTQLNRVKVV
jgi:hypothetical protein